MGNNNLKIKQHQNIHQFIDRFTILTQDQLNHISHMIDQNTKIQYILKQINTNDQINTRNLLKFLQSKKNKPSKYIWKMQQYLSNKQQNYCSNQYTTYILYQKPTQNLRENIIQRKINRKKFTPQQIIQILRIGILALNDLKYLDHPHQQITTANFYIKKGLITLSDPFLINQKLQIKKLKQNYNSPQKLQIMYNRDVQNKKYNWLSSDLFSLGMVGLEMYNLQFMGYIYHRNHKQINQQKLRLKINQIQQKQLNHFIQNLLQKPKGRIQFANAIVRSSDQIIPKKHIHITLAKTQHVDQSTKQISQEISNNIPDKVLNQIPKQPILDYDQTKVRSQSNFYQSPKVDIINISQNYFENNKNQPKINSQRQKFQTMNNKFYNLQLKKMQSTPIRYNINDINNKSTLKNLILQNKILKPDNGAKNMQNDYIWKKNELFNKKNEQYTGSSYQMHNYYSQYGNNLNFLNNKYDKIKAQNSQIFTDSKFLLNILNFDKPHINQQYQHTKSNKTQIQSIKTNSYQNSLVPSNISYGIIYNQKQIESQIKNTSLSTINQINYRSSESLNQSNFPVIITPPIKKNSNKQISTIPQVTQLDHTISQNYVNKGEYVIQSYQKGSKYIGYKKNGMRNGEGKFYYQDGGYYQGEWKDNNMHGYGKLFYKNMKIAYEGNWKMNQFNGYGKIYNDQPIFLNDGFDYKNFNILGQYWQYYEGNLINDCKSGKGKLKLTNGQIFEGEFNDDFIQGKGKYFTNSGEIIKGIWKGSKLIQIER